MRLFSEGFRRAVQIQSFFTTTQHHHHLNAVGTIDDSGAEREPTMSTFTAANLHGCKTLVLVVVKKLRLKGVA